MAGARQPLQPPDVNSRTAALSVLTSDLLISHGTAVFVARINESLKHIRLLGSLGSAVLETRRGVVMTTDTLHCDRIVAVRGHASLAFHYGEGREAVCAGKWMSKWIITSMPATGSYLDDFGEDLCQFRSGPVYTNMVING